MPCGTLRAQVDYGFALCSTKYGSIGCKVWIFRGEVVDDRRGQTYTAGGNA